MKVCLQEDERLRLQPADLCQQIRISGYGTVKIIPQLIDSKHQIDFSELTFCKYGFQLFFLSRYRYKFFLKYLIDIHPGIRHYLCISQIAVFTKPYRAGIPDKQRIVKPGKVCFAEYRLLHFLFCRFLIRLRFFCCLCLRFRIRLCFHLCGRHPFFLISRIRGCRNCGCPLRIRFCCRMLRFCLHVVDQHGYMQRNSPFFLLNNSGYPSDCSQNHAHCQKYRKRISFLPSSLHYFSSLELII